MKKKKFWLEKIRKNNKQGVGWNKEQGWEGAEKKIKK